LLNDTVLNCLFQPRFMPFDLCVRLEPVSKQFSQKAAVFYRHLEHIDVDHFLNRMPDVNWARKIFHRCRNLKVVEKIPMKKNSSNQDHINMMLVSKIPSVVSVSLEYEELTPLDILTLIGMPNLRHVGLFCKDQIYFDPDLDSFSAIEKLRVTSCECDSLFMENLCDPDQLEVLRAIKDPFFESHELVDLLSNYRNLREITIRCDDPPTDGLLNFIDLALNADCNVETLTLEVGYSAWMHRFPQAAEHSGFRKCLVDLRLSPVDDESLETFVPIISQLTRLRRLAFENLSGSLDVDFWFNLLPDLNRLEMKSACSLKSPIFDTEITFHTTYKKRYVFMNQRFVNICFFCPVSDQSAPKSLTFLAKFSSL